MTATNHAATGAVIAFAVQNPVLALPLAFVSHFVLDVLPHHGLPYHERPHHQFVQKRYVIDAVMLALVVFAALVFAGSLWWVVALAMVLSYSPDFVWLYRFFREQKGEQLDKHWFTHFHSRIQWAERPWGWVVEVVWFVAIVAIAVKIVLTSS